MHSARIHQRERCSWMLKRVQHDEWWRSCRRLGADAEQVADGIGQFSPVQRVEVEVPDAAREEGAAKWGGDGVCHERARGRPLVEALKGMAEPVRDRRTALGREL